MSPTSLGYCFVGYAGLCPNSSPPVVSDEFGCLGLYPNSSPTGVSDEFGVILLVKLGLVVSLGFVGLLAVTWFWCANIVSRR